MGLEIRSVDESEPVPKRTVLVLSCDRVTGFFCRGQQTFDHGHYVANMQAAKAAGWVERYSSGQGRIFVCTDCK